MSHLLGVVILRLSATWNHSLIWRVATSHTWIRAACLALLILSEGCGRKNMGHSQVTHECTRAASASQQQICRYLHQPWVDACCSLQSMISMRMLQPHLLCCEVKPGSQPRK
jgi:hypothetical protein